MIVKLTEENKKIIDTKTYKQLLLGWRFIPVGNPWFQGETGKYWAERMSELRNQPEGNSRHVQASKDLGW